MRGQFGAEVDARASRWRGPDGSIRTVYQGVGGGCLERTVVRELSPRALRRGDDGPDEQQHRQHRGVATRTHRSESAEALKVWYADSGLSVR